MIRPLNDFVVIKRSEPPSNVTESGVIKVTREKNPLSEGIVLAVGPGKFSRKAGRTIPLDTQPGERVLFGPHAGTDLAVDGERLLMLRESELFGFRASDNVGA